MGTGGTWRPEGLRVAAGCWRSCAGPATGPLAGVWEATVLSGVGVRLVEWGRADPDGSGTPGRDPAVPGTDWAWRWWE